MRIWTVPYGELDDQRVLGQHREVHMLIGYVQKGYRWGDPFHAGLQLTIDDLEYLWWVHELTVIEMSERGWTGHLTPVHRLELDRDRFRARLSSHTTVNGAQQQADRELLWERWGGSYRGR
jgi:hypothetical protein